MSLIIDTTSDPYGDGLALTPQARMDALHVALEQCRVPADAEHLRQDQHRSAMACARRGLSTRGHYDRMQACEARRKELAARLHGVAAFPANPQEGE